MPSLGGWELIILIGVLVLIFGAKKFPDMARSLGQSARVLKGEMKGLKVDEPRSAPTPSSEPAPVCAETVPAARRPECVIADR